MRAPIGDLQPTWGSEMHLIGFLIMGAIVGWLAGKIMSGHGYGIIWDVVLGIVGSFIGGFGFSVPLGVPPSRFVGSFIVALIGAVVLRGPVHRPRGEGLATSGLRARLLACAPL